MTSDRALGVHLKVLVAALASLAIAAFMPTGWYDTIPRRPDLPPLPFRGVDLLRVTLAVQGLLLLWVSIRKRAIAPISARDLLTLPPPSDKADPSAERRAVWVLCAVTVLAMVLRVIALDSDLWLDEITPILDYGPLPIVQVIGSYLRSNNHLLNTLLLKASVAVFGEHEWSVRLPAVVFGVASIPAMYFTARLALSRSVSLGASLLLAVSYHHIFFSQNARGYTAYLFVALVSSSLFVRALSRDRMSTWAWYVLTLVIGVTALLNTVFVGAAHGLVGLLALWDIRRRGGAAGPLFRRLLAVMAIAAFLGFQLYATALPEVYVVITSTYASQATGFQPFSGEFVRELVRGIAQGFGPGVFLAALPFLAIAGAGYATLLRRNWALALTLTLPGVLTAVFLLARGLTFSPRFFLLWLPLGMMAAAEGVSTTVEWAARALGASRVRKDPKGAATGERMQIAALLLLATISLLALPRYYATPKQPYRAAIAHVESLRRTGDRVAVIHTAEKGMRYYLERTGTASAEYGYVRSVQSFDSLVAAAGGGRVLLVTTFRRTLRVNLRELHGRIEAGWTPERVFSATVGDGSIAVWTPRPVDP